MVPSGPGGERTVIVTPMATLAACFHLLLLIFASIIGGGACLPVVDGGSEMVPVAKPGFGSLVLNETRRKLGSFQICALCTCCGGSKGLCLPSPCCYAIDCNIPNKPFGFCSFTPKTCNCFGCHL